MDKFEYKNIDWKVPIERSILIDKKIDNAALRLYLILLSYARDKVTAFPSRETLAEDMGCSVRNVDLIKNKLKDIGLLDWVTFSNGANKYNVYNLLQYKPIKKRENFNNIKPVENSQEVPQSSVANDKIKEVIKNYQKSYKNFCETSEDLKGYISSGWIDNPNYIPSQGDIRNLNWYLGTYGEASLNKLGISFKFLERYLRDAIEYGDFYTNQGVEIVPTISLFTKAKMQHDKIIRFASDELKKLASQDTFLEDYDATETRRLLYSEK